MVWENFEVQVSCSSSNKWALPQSFIDLGTSMTIQILKSVHCSPIDREMDWGVGVWRSLNRPEKVASVTLMESKLSSRTFSHLNLKIWCGWKGKKKKIVAGEKFWARDLGQGQVYSICCILTRSSKLWLCTEKSTVPAFHPRPTKSEYLWGLHVSFTDRCSRNLTLRLKGTLPGGIYLN